MCPGAAESPIVEFAVDSLKALQKQEARVVRAQAVKSRQGEHLLRQEFLTTSMTSMRRVSNLCLIQFWELLQCIICNRWLRSIRMMAYQPESSRLINQNQAVTASMSEIYPSFMCQPDEQGMRIQLLQSDVLPRSKLPLMCSDRFRLCIFSFNAK